MGSVNITIGIENGKGRFGCTMQDANLMDLTLASAKLDIMKAKLTEQIEKTMQTQSELHFEK